jgi:hypothetical protein
MATAPCRWLPKTRDGRGVRGRLSGPPVEGAVDELGQCIDRLVFVDLAVAELAPLFTLFAGPHWTLLRFGPDAPRLDHEWIRSHQIGADLLDADRQIQQAYDVKDDGPSSSAQMATSAPSPPTKPHWGPTDTGCCRTGVLLTGIAKAASQPKWRNSRPNPGSSRS